MDAVSEKAKGLLEQGVVAVVEILIYGNKADVEPNMDEALNVKCDLYLQDGKKATGFHSGKRVLTIDRYKICGCLVPVYILDAHGLGVFDGKTDDGELISYKGTFQENVFNDVDDNNPAAFHFDGQYKYEGSFKMGKKNGPGKLTMFLEDGQPFVYQSGRFVNDVFKTGKQYIKSKPRFYRMYENGMEGEEGEDPVEGEDIKESNLGGMKIDGDKIQLEKGQKATIKKIEAGALDLDVKGTVHLGKTSKVDPNADLNLDSVKVGNVKANTGGDFTMGGS